MTHTAKKILITLGIAAMALTACGNDPQETEREPEAPVEETDVETMDDASDTWGHGTYRTYTSSGAIINFDLPTEPSHESLTEIEQYRDDVEVSAEPVTYIVAEVDNRDGSQTVGLPGISVFDPDGNEYEFTGVSNYINDISPETDWEDDGESYILRDGTKIPRHEGFDLYNKGVELHNEYLDGIKVAGAGEMILVYEGEDFPDEFTRVATWPHGMGEADEATPVNPAHESAADDYTSYLTDEQREAATEDQLASYNECMQMVESDFEAANREFDGMDAHYNCISAIEGPQDFSETSDGDSNVDWEYMREISECYDQLVIEKPEILDDLPQEAILEDPTIVLEHPEVQASCL